MNFSRDAWQKWDSSISLLINKFAEGPLVSYIHDFLNFAPPILRPSRIRMHWNGYFLNDNGIFVSFIDALVKVVRVVKVVSLTSRDKWGQNCQNGKLAGLTLHLSVSS